MIYYANWEQDYFNLVQTIFDRIDPSRVEIISLGTLRMTPRLKKIIESRFADNTILDEELAIGHDGKMRYSFDVRIAMYKEMKAWISARAPDVFLYLCMEEKDACR